METKQVLRNMKEKVLQKENNKESERNIKEEDSQSLIKQKKPSPLAFLGQSTSLDNNIERKI